MAPADSRAEAILRHYWRIFYKRRWVLVAALGLGIAAALIVTLLMQREYTSGVTLEVSREAPNIIDIQQVDQSDSQSPDLEFYQTQYALLKSRSLSEAVVRDLNLANNYLYLAGNKESDVKEVRDMPLQDRLNLATQMVNDNTSVAPVRGSRIINVEFTSPDPDLSAKVANSIAQNFIESNLSRHFEAAAYARDFLQNQLRQVRARLEDSERKAVLYAQQQGLIKFRTGTGDNASEQSLLANQLSEFSSQLTAAHAARAQAEAQYREGLGGSAAEQSLSSTSLNTLREQRAELIAQQTKLQSDFGPQYPPLIALHAQIGEIDKQINREESRVSSSVAQDLQGKYQQALAAENALQQKVDALKAAMIGEEGRSIQYNILQRDVDTNRALYDALLQRFKDVGVAGGVGTNNVAIVDPPVVPDHASSPNVLLNLGLGLVLGLILGGALALLLEQLAESVVLPSEFQAKLRVPLLGTTPAVGKQSLATRFLPKPGGASANLPEKAEEDTYNSAVHGSEVSEAYLSIVTSIRFSTSHGAPKSISITSTQEKEGKTTSAIAIARTLASTGSRVLLIDADMRRPALHRSFDLADRRGLSEVLTGHAKWDEVVHATDEPRLSIMTAGKIPPSPAELLSGSLLAQVVTAATEHFDNVVIDCPPLLGLADAPLISQAVEGTVFVMEAGRTRSSEARHALDRLAAVHARVIGAVLTKLDHRSAGYGYGHSYTYKYSNA
ncbi:MAG: GumC family protein [Bacillota bacterium]